MLNHFSSVHIKIEEKWMFLGAFLPSSEICLAFGGVVVSLLCLFTYNLNTTKMSQKQGL